MFVILLAFLFTKRGHFLAIQWETASWIIQILSSLIVEHEILGGRKKDNVKVGNLQGIKCQMLHKRPKYIARKCPRQCCAGKFFTDCKRLCDRRPFCYLEENESFLSSSQLCQLSMFSLSLDGSKTAHFTSSWNIGLYERMWKQTGQ